jgi:hypothetical protein
MTMNVKSTLLSFFFLLALLPLSAQVFRPLEGYENLAPKPDSKAAPRLTKVDCEEFDLEAFQLLAPGESLALRAGLDTAGLGGPPFTYNCDGCAEASAGTATVERDTLFYGADAGAEFGLDTLRLSVCNAAGMCSNERTFIVLVRRAGREISLGTFTVAPRGEVDVPVPAGDLPGGATCRTIEACAEDYEGRGQDFFFLTGQRDGNEFRYRAAGLDGVDRVCVTLCNDFGICDTYTAGFSINVARVNLPFFDDFAYEGTRPNPVLWQDDDVLINRNFPQDPPSIGVATFDGVDLNGQPYAGGSGGQRTVIRDYLTSAPVNAQGANGTTLTFFLQPRGFGNRPETQDSFLVQFRDVAGNWNTVYQQEGEFDTRPNNFPMPFEPVLVEVPAQYLYDGFQFRFFNRSSERGAVDMWHLDYVKLSNRLTAFNVQDLAFTDLPDFLLKEYSSLPLRHYRASNDELLRQDYTVAVRNLNNDVLNISSGSFNILTEVPNSPAVTSPDLTIFFPGTNNAIAPQTLEFRAGDISSVPGVVSDIVDFLNNSADPDERLNLRTLYGMSIDNQDDDFANGAFKGNDTVVRVTTFDEYMAYDDGTAEVILEGGQGTTILQQYEAFVADELKGIQIRIPRVLSSLGSQELRLVVYNGEGQPDELLAEFDFPIRFAETFFRDSLQGYTTYIFPETVPIPEGSFYVGWEQQRANTNIGVGFDRNNSPENVQWFDNGNGWMPLTGSTTGAIMVRPLLAGFAGFPTSVSEYTDAEALVDVFPNPTNGTLHLRTRPGINSELSYRLFSLTGALLATDQLTERIELGHLPSGIYLLEVTDGVSTSRHKIVRR